MDLRYPIGKFTYDGPLTDLQRGFSIDQIEQAPVQLRHSVERLLPDQLDTPYRPGGWTIRQVVHHLPDSHLNSCIRFKLALTEDNPTIKPYFEDRWAQLLDAHSSEPEISLALLESLQRRWVTLLRSLSADQCLRTFYHPDQGVVTLKRNISLYAWHGRHHIAHITSLRERMNW